MDRMRFDAIVQKWMAGEVLKPFEQRVIAHGVTAAVHEQAIIGQDALRRMRIDSEGRGEDSGR